MSQLAKNKRAFFDYEHLSTFEAGISLSGQEVKSMKTGHISLKGAFVTVHKGELYLTNAFVPPYKFAGKLPNYDPYQSRKLLVSKAQLNNLIGRAKTDGLTIVPLSVYTKGRYIKVGCAVARGKKEHDKRATIKKRDSDRSINRVLKG